MINVYIVSGFLGAGKTTLIQRMLSGMKDVMLIENEFGEVGVDASFFQSGLQVKEINNGCICCSLQGDFASALDEIRSYHVSNVIIEPSGVGKLSDIMPTVLQQKDMRLVCHACVVDVKTAQKYHKNFKAFFDDQVIMANAIVLSHLDVAERKTIDNAIEIVRMLNDEAEINTRPIGEYSHAELLDFLVKNVVNCAECSEFGEGNCSCFPQEHAQEHEAGCTCEKCQHAHEQATETEHHHHHHHHDDDPFESITFRPTHRFKKEELSALLAQLDEDIIRCKGYVLSQEETLYFNYVLNEANIFTGPKQAKGLVVVIGTTLDEKELAKMFDRYD